MSLTDLQKKLQKRREENRFRSLQTVLKTNSAARIELNRNEFIHFGNNDYLGLSNHPLIRERSMDYTRRFGTSSSSSRLIAGSLKIHEDLEKKLAGLYRSESVLLFNTGFQANSTILPALTTKGDWILADKRSHNSLIQGGRLSRAEFFRYRHNDLNHLEFFLKKSLKKSAKTVWVVSESLFSMDGDQAPLGEMIQLTKKYGAKLYVDDAHAIGVLGSKGLGICRDFEGIDVLVGTFGKAAGAFGAFAAFSTEMSDALINFGNGFIYSTSLPPAVIGAVDAAFDLIPEMNRQREQLRENSLLLSSILQKKGFGNASSSHIIPIIAGSDAAAVALSGHLFKNGIFATAIRPPTVPEGESRIRFSVTSDHIKDDFLKLEKILNRDFEKN